ncbi:MAG: transposase [Gemmatimonadetes bacterium]|nr:transposase [Gemmatimonadota bacterium]
MSWDYSTSAVYFLTINTAQRSRLLSRIVQAQVMLFPLGEIVTACWRGIPGHVPGVELGRFVVMPDHVHGVLMLPRGARSLSYLVAHFKGAVTRQAREAVTSVPGRIWQRSFHDRIIRSPAEWQRIDQYIADNPARWTG